MLVLTRRQGESIIIGDGIKLTVVSVGPGRVKIGITVPPNVRIDREEIHSRIQKEQLHSSEADVLAAVTSEAIENQSEQNTIISSASETGIFNKSLFDKSQDDPHVVSPAKPVTSSAKVANFRPHKPR